MIHQVDKPIHRSNLRRALGREFYIAKRRLSWLFSRTRFSKVDRSVNFPNVWMDHRSVLLRKLKDVDMHLQYNKITNLKLAVAKLDGVVIKPGAAHRPHHKGTLASQLRRHSRCRPHDSLCLRCHTVVQIHRPSAAEQHRSFVPVKNFGSMTST